MQNMEELYWGVEMNFQIIPKSYDSGWIHSDERGSSQITGIIYLSPNANLNGGTSIYRNKSNIVQHINLNDEFKKDSYLNNTKVCSLWNKKEYLD